MMTFNLQSSFSNSQVYSFNSSAKLLYIEEVVLCIFEDK